MKRVLIIGLLVLAVAAIPAIDLAAWIAGRLDAPAVFLVAWDCRTLLVGFCLFLAVQFHGCATDDWWRRLPRPRTVLLAGVAVLAVTEPGPGYWALRGYHTRVCRTLDVEETLRWARALGAREELRSKICLPITEITDAPPSVRTLVGESLNGRLITVWHAGSGSAARPHVEIAHRHFIVIVPGGADQSAAREPSNWRIRPVGGSGITVELGSSGLPGMLAP
jgi:hypothetical protein